MLFVSFSKHDERRALSIARMLWRRGCDVWLPERDTMRGADAERDSEALAIADAVLVVWSTEAAGDSRVRSEVSAVAAARERGVGTRLIVATLDDTPPPATAAPYLTLELSDGEEEQAITTLAGRVGSTAPTPDQPPRVPLVYCHDAMGTEARALELASTLRAGGIDCRIDQQIVWPTQGWAAWLREELLAADDIVLLWTPTLQRWLSSANLGARPVPSASAQAASGVAGVFAAHLRSHAGRCARVCIVVDGSFSDALPSALAGHPTFQLPRDGRSLKRALQGAGYGPHEPGGAWPRCAPASRRSRGWSGWAGPSVVPTPLAAQLAEAAAAQTEARLRGGDVAATQERVDDLTSRLLDSGEPLQCGALLDKERFFLVASAGHGVQAQVWTAWDRDSQELVAFKMLDLEVARDEAARQRFVQGARHLAELAGHPSVVTLRDAPSAIPPTLYFTMEHVAGGTLARAIASGEVGPPALVGVLAQIAAAVDHVHNHGLVHRRLNPTNVLRADDGRWRVTDLSAAATRSSVSPDPLPLSPADPAAAHIAPEVIAGTGPVAPAADVWSAAGIALSILLGRPLTPADLEPAALLRHPWASEAQRDVLTRALDRAPDSRYPSVVALVQALRQPRSPLAAITRRQSLDRPDETAPPARRPAGSGSTGLALAGVAALVVAGVGAWLWLAAPVPGPSSDPVEGAASIVTVVDHPVPELVPALPLTEAEAEPLRLEPADAARLLAARHPKRLGSPEMAAVVAAADALVAARAAARASTSAEGPAAAGLEVASQNYEDALEELADAATRIDELRLSLERAIVSHRKLVVGTDALDRAARIRHYAPLTQTYRRLMGRVASRLGEGHVWHTIARLQLGKVMLDSGAFEKGRAMVLGAAVDLESALGAGDASYVAGMKARAHDYAPEPGPLPVPDLTRF